jgi:DNA-binding CsgD family transcriptional regulator
MMNKGVEVLKQLSSGHTQKEIAAMNRLNKPTKGE